MAGRLIGMTLVGTRGTFAGDSRDGVAKGCDDRDRVSRVERREGERKKKVTEPGPAWVPVDLLPTWGSRVRRVRLVCSNRR